MSGQWHPDTDTIASLAAGLDGGFRARRVAAHVAGCPRCAAVSEQLGEVSSMLASVPAAAMPEAFERQISAAIATEAAARAAGTSPAGVGAAGQERSDGDHADRDQPSSRPRPARSRRAGGFRLRPAMALVPAGALVLAGIIYLAGHGASPSYSSPEYGVAAPEASASAPASAANGLAPAAEPAHSRALAFMVIHTGTHYEASTLRAQVRGELQTKSVRSPGVVPSAEPSAVPSASASSSSTAVNTFAGSTSGASAVAPSQHLVGCVLSVTGGVKPSFVDQAYYQGKPAYVIAVPGTAWVVGLGCTSSHPDVIASVALRATP